MCSDFMSVELLASLYKTKAPSPKTKKATTQKRKNEKYRRKRKRRKEKRRKKVKMSDYVLAKCCLHTEEPLADND